jgi:hypothetical protein
MTMPIIPGAREPGLPVPRQPGAMGGAANGTDTSYVGSSLDDATASEHHREGGGPRKVTPRGAGGA